MWQLSADQLFSSFKRLAPFANIYQMTRATLGHSFVPSRIDYCNSLLATLPNCVLSKLQKVQNVASHILTRRCDAYDISPVPIDIHWLFIPLRICYKISFLTFKCLHQLGPPYLEIFSLPINLNETSDQLPKDCLKNSFETYGRCAYFVAAAPSFRNDLNNLSTYKKAFTDSC